MQNKFIIDKEVNLNECDYLKTKVYSDNLTSIIKNTDNDKVFTIGLFGSWGTGKSSIIKTSKQDFDQTKVKFITYDAWQYVNDSFRRMFLRKLREDLKYEETDLMKKFYENESIDTGNKYQLSSTRLCFILGGLFLLWIAFNFIPFEVENKIRMNFIFTMLALFITIISGVFHQLKISVTKPHLFAPEQFAECFNEIVSNSLKKTNAVLKWVKGDNSIQNLEKIVIVIDNIDRCSNDIAYNLLTDIKTFLSSEPYSIVFIIPVDDVALRKHIINSNKNSDDCDKDKEEFLRKFFNVTIRIKPYGETDMFAFAKQVSEKYNLNFKPETINLASKEYAKNPRRVIQLFNNLLAELNYYDAEFVQKNETLICSVLIAREEYPDFYESLVNSPKLFIEKELTPFIPNDNLKEEIDRFIRIAHSSTSEVDIADLSEILTNSHNQFDDIATDLKDSIQTFEVEEVLIYCKTEKERIIDYIVDRLENALKNQLTDTELVAYFDLITEINKKYPLDNHSAKRIDEKVMPYLSMIIEKSKNHKNLCYYALSRNNQGNGTVKNKLIEGCTGSLNEFWQSLFSIVLQVFNDKDTSIALSSTCTNFPQFIKYECLSVEQIEYLISNEFVQQRISELPRNESNSEILFDTKTAEYETVKWLFENKKNITVETYATLLEAIIGDDNSENRMRGKTTDEIADILKFANPLLNLIPDRKLTTQPQTLYSLIVNNRKMPHPSYPNHTQYDQSANFIDECIKEEKHITEISDFVINAYRISPNNIDVNAEINKLPQYTYLHKEFIQLIDKGYNLRPILDTIFDNDTNSNDSDRIIVLKHCFNQKNNNGAYSISEEKVRTKLNDLLTYAQEKKSVEVFTLLETLSEQERYKKLLADLIVEKDSTFVNSLPQKLLKLAINSFKKENSNDFADNFEFLSVIMQNGTKAQKGYVVKILNTKLDSDQEIEQTLNLIDKMQDISTFDKSGLLHSHLDSYQRDNKDSISEEVYQQIEQLKKKTK